MIITKLGYTINQEKLNRAFLKSGKTFTEIAKACGVSKDIVFYIIIGPNAGVVYKESIVNRICKVLGLKLEDVLTKGGDTNAV